MSQRPRYPPWEQVGAVNCNVESTAAVVNRMVNLNAPSNSPLPQSSCSVLSTPYERLERPSR